MKTKINPVALGITIVGLAALITWLIIFSHHGYRFVPTPPPATITSPIPTSDIPSGASDQSNSSTDQSSSVCYILTQPSNTGQGNDEIYLKLTAGADTVTGQLATNLVGQAPQVGTLTGTMTAGSAANQYVFSGQLTTSVNGQDNSMPETIQVDSTQAQLNNGSATLSIPRVDCSQYPSLL